MAGLCSVSMTLKSTYQARCDKDKALWLSERLPGRFLARHKKLHKVSGVLDMKVFPLNISKTCKSCTDFSVCGVRVRLKQHSLVTFTKFRD